jgi:hypothetical protein
MGVQEPQVSEVEDQRASRGQGEDLLELSTARQVELAVELEDLPLAVLA